MVAKTRGRAKICGVGSVRQQDDNVDRENLEWGLRLICCDGVLPANSLRQKFRPLASLLTGVLRAHVAGVKDPTTKLTMICGEIIRLIILTDDPTSIGDDPLIY